MAQSKLLHILGRRSWSEWLIFVVLLGSSALLGNKLSASTLWIDARASLYQLLSVFGRTEQLPQRTAIVLLDDQDYWTERRGDSASEEKKPQLAGRAPTNRAYLAELVRRLDEAGVGLMVLDFDLRTPNPTVAANDLTVYSEEDKALFAAITDACLHHHQVVLANELTLEKDGPRAVRNIYDSAQFSDTCVHQGYIELPRDIRRVPVTVTTASGEDRKSLSLAAVEAADVAASEAMASLEEKDFPYSHFLPLSAFAADGVGRTRFTGREILEADSASLAPLLLNRIVLIGADWHTLALGQGPYADRHPTPAGDLPGVILHANYIEAALQNGISKAFPEKLAVLLEILLVCCLSLFGMLEIHWAWKWGVVLASSFVVVVFGYLLLRTFGLVLDFFFPLIFLGLHSGYEHLHEWRHGAERE